MVLLATGVILVIVGIAMTAMRTADRGRLSQPNTEGTSTRPDTLEPTGKGRRLSLKTDLPGLGMAALGALFILIGVFM